MERGGVICPYFFCVLAFYKDPEKWVTGSCIKIGYFGDLDADLRYQDEVHGYLIEQVDRTVDC